MLSRRQLNRATLARQQLLDRSTLSPLAMTEHLVGWQAQTAKSWYVGFWGRIQGVQPSEVSVLLERRELVRIALMRATIHLVTAQDCVALRSLMQPILDRTVQGAFGKNLVGLDRAAVGAAGRRILEQRPMLFSELGRALAELWPDRDAASLAQLVRASEALVQVTPRGLWGRSGAAAHTSAQAWLGSGARRRRVARPARPSLPGRIRPGERQGRAAVVRPDSTRPGRPTGAAVAGLLRRGGRAGAVRPARRTAAVSRCRGAGAIPVRLRQPAAQHADRGRFFMGSVWAAGIP